MNRQGTLDIAPPMLGFGPEAEVRINLQEILAGRLVLTASSGAGKSWMLRQLAEETCETIPQLIIDWEGEFDSLREIHPYVVIGAIEDGANVEASMSTARAVTRRLMIAKASVIVDVSEFDVDERREFVGLVLSELMSLRKVHYHRRLVIIDEAHEFCPQVGTFTSSKPVRAVVARGRKRGFGAILATQRLAKLDKDVAEAANTLTGQTVLDVDLERAGEALGFSRKQHSEIELLRRGQFWAKGRAFSDDGVVMLVRSGPVRTKHPDGTHDLTAVPLPHEIAEALQSLQDIQRDPLEDAGRQELLEQIARLEMQLKAAKEGNSSDPADIRRAVEAATSPLNAQLTALQMQVERARTQARMILLDLGEMPPAAPDRDLDKDLDLATAAIAEQIDREAPELTHPNPPVFEPEDVRSGTHRTNAPKFAPPRQKLERLPPSPQDIDLEDIEWRMRNHLVAAGDDGMSSEDVAEKTGQSPTSSTFRQHRKRLVDTGHAEYIRGQRGWIRFREIGGI